MGGEREQEREREGLFIRPFLQQGSPILCFGNLKKEKVR